MTRLKKILLILAGVLLIIAAPVILWHAQKKEALAIQIIDYTVPSENYREHQSLTWLLNHNRFTTAEQTAFNREEHYIGMKPDESEEVIDLYRYPDSFDGQSLIYVADTYGVYESDLPWSTTGEAEPGSSDLIEGGLKQEHWNMIKNQVLEQDTDLVMEFNTFASPTDETVRKDVMDFLQVNWTGWIGRYFPELDREADELPQWVVSQYEKQSGEWTFSGEGFILLNEASSEVIVLTEEDLDETSIRLSFTESGQELFDLETSPAYRYWFDILIPENETEVAAWYDWSLTDTGTSKLSAAGIPEIFPAVMHHKKKAANIYYFAGDYADAADMPAFYQVAGMSAVQSMLSFESVFPDKSFFWRTVSPLMETVFNRASEEDTIIATDIEQAEHEGLSYPARIHEQTYEVYRNGDWEPITIKGVNMGMGKPGAFPGEAAITYEEYYRWFEQIDQMNANTIRVYTLHPPAFYDALADYNAEAEEPLYVFHGVWADEEPLEESLDAYNEESVARFQMEMTRLVDVIHGNATVEPEPGHASGVYRSDVSPYVIGWVLGIEWYPYMVDEMKKKYPDLSDYEGQYVSSENAEPMEVWLAEQMDLIATYEAEEYQSMRPLSFTNWVTTDHLEQPAEPLEQEDLASINPNHIQPEGAVTEAGMFASYHVYPYYPDFLYLEEKYTEFVDHRGEKNHYAGYLADLQNANDIPVLIAEFGIPASRGMTHRNQFGLNQGFMSEMEQGEALTRLYEDIIEADMLGGLVFSWQDEWFKRTWNTADYDNSDRRPYWSNAQTNEQQFGLLSFDRHTVRINGEPDEGLTSLYEGDGVLKSLDMSHDERYVYLQMSIDNLSEDFWDNHSLNIYADVHPELGISQGGMNADFKLEMKGQEAALQVAGDYDSFYLDYAKKLKLIPDNESIDEFHPIRLALNKGIVRPDTGEEIPFDAYDTGKLRFGIGDPEHPDYDSLADYIYNPDNGLIEIRIPWMLLNAKDPSNHEFMGNIQKDDITSVIEVENIKWSAELLEGSEQVDQLGFDEPQGYTWEKWDLPETEERLKQSYDMLKELFGNTN
ncbi:hypothetical protein [Jeotgalibacillus sp. R-1-5s-1]|uniref:hypothetical protein n=1 Tax=Jeotgalibacillus sp. R-1-5s-1 TaxID=2555897 RepID=UPI00352B1E69